MSNESLGTLRSKLRARLGFSGVGAAAGVQQENLNVILQQAQRLLYEAHDWARLREYSEKTVGVNQHLIDYPVNANPDRIRAISVLRSGVWSPPLEKGIRPSDYTNQDQLQYPVKWEPYAQIELFPKSDAVYTLRIFYIRNLDRFTNDDDNSTIDSDLIFTVALGDAKAHYRHPDAKVFMDRADSLLMKLKGQSWGRDVFRPSEYVEEVIPKPVVV